MMQLPINYFKPLFIFLGVLLFFPSITFSAFSGVEIFPWALIFTFLFSKSYDKKLLLLITLMFVSCLWTLYTAPNGIIFQVVRSLLAYLNPLMLFVFLLKADYKVIEWLLPILKKVFYLMLIIGFMQYSGLFGFLEPIFDFLVSRGMAISYSGGRGISILASEPARVGYELIFIYAIFRIVFLKKNKIIWDIFIIFFILFMVKSSIAAGYLIVFLLIYYRLYFLLFGTISLSIFLMVGNHIESRAIDILSNSLIHIDRPDVIFNIYLQESGHRLVSILSAFYYGMLNPLGGGIGNWEISSLQSFAINGYEANEIRYFRNGWASSRGASYISALILDVGIIGVVYFLWFIRKKIAIFWNISTEMNNVILFFLFYLFFIGSIGDPVPWLTSALGIRYIQHNLKANNIMV